MSKSYHNFVAIESTANEKFVRLMEIKDELIIRYFENCTSLYSDEISLYKKRLDDGEHPREVKKELAHIIVTIWHGSDEADSAQAYFEKAISGGGRPDDKDIEIVKISTSESIFEYGITSTA